MQGISIPAGANRLFFGKPLRKETPTQLQNWVGFLFVFSLTNSNKCAILVLWVLRSGRRFLPIWEVIRMAVTYSDLFLFVSMITGIISLCYLVFHNKKNRLFFGNPLRKETPPYSVKVTVFLFTKSLRETA